MTDKMVKPIKAKKAKKEKIQTTRMFFILDRSGSMSSIAAETIGSFNAYVDDQKTIPGNATFSLVQFDHEYQVVHNDVPLQEVPKLTSETFQPRGMTALYDAVGMTISRFKDDNPKSTKTIVAILTDGAENSSKEFNYQSVQHLIKEVQDEKGWDVIFMGANMDAKSVAQNLGIKANNSVTFDFSAKGALDAISSVSMATRSLRGQAVAYADGSLADASNFDMTKMYGDFKANAVKLDPNAPKA